jgi:hydrogenase maturation protein HypF
LVVVDDAARVLLTSPQRPIVLLERRPEMPIADAVAPGNRYLGVMLAYTPLHHLLFRDERGQSPFAGLVMTSGNAREEPIAVGNREAIARLAHLADAFLLHDRDILTRCDDSVVRPSAIEGAAADRAGAEDGAKLHTALPASYIRRARGFVPLPVFVDRDVDGILAVGGELKSVIALGRDQTVFLSQHLGDLENLEAYAFFREAIDRLQTLLEIAPATVAYDLHPDYLSTRFALGYGLSDAIGVQHHHAHVAACMAEHGLEGPVLGLALDGTGYGTDGRVWGGELLRADYASFTRIAHLREVPLPGGEAAIRQPWRMALSWLHAVYGSELFALPIPFVRQLDRAKAEVLVRAMAAEIQCPLTSSCGRLFDAVAALIGVRQTNTFEGQAAMELEMLAPTNGNLGSYRTEPGEEQTVLDPEPIIRGVVNELVAGTPAPVISQRFHNSLAELFATACAGAADPGPRQVVLSGGCMQNQYFVGRLATRLSERAFRVYTHQQVPPNDGGLALGQIMVAARIKRDRSNY